MKCQDPAAGCKPVFGGDSQCMIDDQFRSTWTLVSYSNHSLCRISVRRRRTKRPVLRDGSSRKRWQATGNAMRRCASLNWSSSSRALTGVLTFRVVLPESCDHSVYPRCTSVRRFCSFPPFCPFVGSISYVVSVSPRGSTPPASMDLSCL